MGLENEVAIVTASSSGLGKAISKSLFDEGASVTVNGRTSSRLQSSISDISQGVSSRTQGVTGDISNSDDCETIIEKTVAEFGKLDHLIINTGGPPLQPFQETTEDQFYEAYDQMVMSSRKLIEVAKSHLMKDGGTITIIASISVKEPIKKFVLTNSIRIPIVGMAKTLSMELAPSVRSNVVMPGYFDTGTLGTVEYMVDTGSPTDYQEAQELLENHIPLGRFGRPEELGDFVAFLCSSKASYINGQAIPVAGGVLSTSL